MNFVSASSSEEIIL